MTRRILCIRLDALGDVLMTGPALKALKLSNPSAHITLLTSPGGSAAAGLMNDILDEVILYDAPWMKASAAKPPAKDLEFFSSLQSKNFEAALIFTVYSQSPLPAALMCYLAGIPQRIAICRENPYGLLTHWIRETEPETLVRHEVDRQLHLVESFGCAPLSEPFRLCPSKAAGSAVDGILKNLGLRSDFVVIHPGATAPSRRYPPEKFAAVARTLLGDLQIPVVFTGIETEIPLVESIRSAVVRPSTSLAGQLKLEEFAELLRKSRLLISNNTGAVHVACGVGTPVVDLYALTNPQHTPWGGVPHKTLFHNVPCRYCYKSICPQGHNDCLFKISPQEVVDAAKILLDSPPLSHSLREAAL